LASIPKSKSFEQALLDAVAFWGHAARERQERKEWSMQPTAEQRDEAARRFVQRCERESRMAYTRARNKICLALALEQVAAGGARRPVATRERRERPRARRSVASRDGPGELDPPPAAPSWRRPEGWS
jgi:hypothetical protein